MVNLFPVNRGSTVFTKRAVDSRNNIHNDEHKNLGLATVIMISFPFNKTDIFINKGSILQILSEKFKPEQSNKIVDCLEMSQCLI